MRASLKEHEGRVGDKEENDEAYRRRQDGPAQEVIKSGVEVEVMAGMRDVVALPTVCPVLAAAIESRLSHRIGLSVSSCG
jgi:hypothetical protein